MEQYILYLLIKKIIGSLNDKMKCTFNDMDSNRENVIGIYVKGAEPSRYRDLRSGVYFNHTCRLQILIQGGRSNSSLMNVLLLSSILRDTLIKASNRLYIVDGRIDTDFPPEMRYYVSDEENNGKSDEVSNIGEDIAFEVRLNKVDLMGETDFKGKSSQGLPRYSINFKVVYSVERRE